MYNIRFLTFLFLIFLSLSGYSDEILGKQLEDREAEVLAKMLAVNFAPFVKTISRDIETYNYRQKETLGIGNDDVTPTNSTKAIEYANKWRDSAFKFNPNDYADAHGWGLYTASDPTNSFSFGEDSDKLALTVVRFKKGSRFLDLRGLSSNNTFPISKNIFEQLDRKCTLKFRDDSFKEEIADYKFVQKATLTENPYCRQIYKRAVEILNLSSILYRWGADYYSDLCTNKKNIVSAFVLLNSELTKETVSVFTKQNFSKLSTDDQEKYRYVTKLIRNEEFKGKWQDAKDSNLEMSNSEIEKFRRETFGCDEKYSEEDMPELGNGKEVVSLMNKMGIKAIADIQQFSNCDLLR